jgi:hypothetical protein
MLGRALQHGTDEIPAGAKGNGTAAPQAVSKETDDG